MQYFVFKQKQYYRSVLTCTLIVCLFLEKVRKLQTEKQKVEEKERITNKEIQRLQDSIVKLEKVS